MLGNVLSRGTDEAPQKEDVKALFKKAWKTKNQWAEQRTVTGNSKADDIFKTEAKKLASPLDSFRYQNWSQL